MNEEKLTAEKKSGVGRSGPRSSRMLRFIGSHWRTLRRSGVLYSYFVKGLVQL